MVGQVHHIKSAEEYEQLKASPDRLIVADFSAVWCGPCRMIAPKFEELSSTYEDVTFIHVDVDENDDVQDAQDVSGVPTFKFFKNSKQVASFSGANAGKLEELIKANK